jgi:chromosome partitioning protein
MPAYMIVVAGPKGGCGKTTTAANLLVGARLAGIEAGGLDLDPQGSLMMWSRDRARLGHEPHVRVTAGRLKNWRDAVATVAARLVVVDLAPGLDEEREAVPLRSLARAAGLVLIPALAEGPTVRMLGDVGAALGHAGARVAFVMNKTIAGRAILGDARAYLERRGELLPVEIPQRDAVHRAMDQGLGVVEDPALGGYQQYRELWRLVADRLGMVMTEAV